jgi:hypothetical protein
MAKKSTEPERKTEVIYVEVPPWIKRAMEELAAEHDRKLTGEVTLALKRYIAAERPGGSAS